MNIIYTDYNLTKMIKESINEGYYLYYKDYIKIYDKNFKTGDIKLVGFEDEQFIEKDYYLNNIDIERMYKIVPFKIHTDKKIKYGHLQVDLILINNVIEIDNMNIKRFYCWEYINKQEENKNE